MEIHQQVSLEEAIELGASSNMFFAYYFFPETFKLAPGIYHERLFHLMDNLPPGGIGLEIFRDSAKTTCMRAFGMRRACYGISNYTSFIGESEGIAAQSVDWFKYQVETNRRLQQAFGLRIGSIANTTQLEILRARSGQDGEKDFYLEARGVEGSNRGRNRRDERPDTLILDDTATESTALTAEARKSLNAKIFGSIFPSLASTKLNPAACFLLANTRLAEDDPIGLMKLDSMMKVFSFSVFTEEGKSAWESKWSTAELIQQKQSYQQRNQAAIWLREKENVISRNAERIFLPTWMKYMPREMCQGAPMVLAVDPVPPPTDGMMSRAELNTDYEVWTVAAIIGRRRVNFIDERSIRGHSPQGSIQVMCELLSMYPNIVAIGVESYLFQKVLAYVLQQALAERQIYKRIVQIEDKRKKMTRITDVLGVLAAPQPRGLEMYPGEFYVDGARCPMLFDQFGSYPDVKNDDALDSATTAVLTAQKMGLLLTGAGDDDNDDVGSDAAIEAQLRAQERGLQPINDMRAP